MCSQPLQALKLLHSTQAAWRTQLTHDLVLATLVVRRRAKAARAGGLQRDALDEAVEGQVEIKTRLLAIGDDIQPGRDLVLDGHLGGVVLHFTYVRTAKLSQMTR